MYYHLYKRTMHHTIYPVRLYIYQTQVLATQLAAWKWKELLDAIRGDYTATTAARSGRSIE